MELTLLTVPGCPNTAVFEERLAAALAGYPGAVVRRREVADERQAAEAGMHGSPTLLVDGVDPFAAPSQLPSLSCRLYRDAAGHTEGAPPVDVLRRVLQQAIVGG
jgi:predicted DsbA family dithiol-disulfide isomerase